LAREDVTDAERIADLEYQVAYLRERLEGRFDASAQVCERLGLTPQLARLLLLLYHAGGRLVTHQWLEHELPNGKPFSERETPDAMKVLVSLLRKRIGWDSIETKWGYGYRLTAQGMELAERAVQGIEVLIA
jgi:DNA-binding response OmpR family regulator